MLESIRDSWSPLRGLEPLTLPYRRSYPDTSAATSRRECAMLSYNRRDDLQLKNFRIAGP